MRIVVVGAGAIGSLFGALLHGAGHDVTLVGRPRHVTTILQDGLRVEGRTSGTYRVRATAKLPVGFSTDLCLLTVKTYDLDEAASVFGRAVSTPVPVAALENGLGVETTVERSLESAHWSHPSQWIVRGINSVPATFVRPGVVRQAGAGELLLADYKFGRHADVVAEAFRSAGVPVRVVPDRATEVWRKVLVNAAINPVTADHRISNGALLLDPYRGQALQLLHEALTVARAEGMTFSEEEAEEELWRVVRATSDNRSSMLQDLEQGRRTEIDAISGAVLAQGQAHGLALPATARAVQRIHLKEPRRVD